MITIQLILDQQVIGEYDFPDNTPFVTIGRHPSHDICLDNLAVSGNHARLIFDTGHITVVDMRSSNGTLLNGVAISRPTAMNPDDTIQIAKFIVKVRDDRQKYHDESDREPSTIAISGTHTKMHKTGAFSYDDIKNRHK